MYIHIHKKDGITLGDLRTVVQETEQLPEDTIVYVPSDFCNSQEANIKVTEVIAENKRISFCY